MKQVDPELLDAIAKARPEGRIMSQIGPELLDAIAESTADERVGGLMSLLKAHYDPAEGVSVKSDDNGDLYVGCISRIAESAFDEYFGGRLTPQEQEAVEGILPSIPDGMIDEGISLGLLPHAKRYEDHVVQFVMHGEFWSSKPGYAWALYGHVLSVRK